MLSTLALVSLPSVHAQAGPPLSARDAAWRAQIRHTLYVPDELPPLEAKTWSSFSPVAGVIAERVTYATASGMRVPAIVYRPEKRKGKLPGIVVVNGHGGDKFAWYAFYSGMMFARAGAVVVTYDPIGEGERNIDRKSRAGSHDAIVATPEGVPADDWGQRLAGLMQVDVMQAVAYLGQRPEVDPKRIATVGYSMGAFITGITGAIDPAIHAVLLSGGGTFDDEADGGKSFDTGKLPCQAPPWRSLRILGDEFHKRGAVLYTLNADRGPMLVENGSMDEVMDIPHRGPEWFAAMRAQAVALHGSDRNLFTTHVDPGMSHRTAWVERPGVAWLNEQIHFANWTAADIERMPTTHISDWAHANDVDITPNYMKENREGGLNALGTGLPGIAREQLMVLPADEWEREKNVLTYESWKEKTMAAEQAMKR
ncbi:Acetyl xylan esterase (AXE1) [Granulicella rosea]|uniref:Acetyl xylan esterase (AXE1) n=1 Tax=Granulicella rosea TaxID=474952 RepID=A0A239LB36_9BACT|nr:acetylxylan esterase [Granulicella rosea]SNT27691.1 Acetyl xylan esterase (AXE1) [Granulicella rosea]